MTVGLVQLPGMMTGQILAGTSPLVAVRYQIMVVLMLAMATGIGAWIFLRLAVGRYLKLDAAGKATFECDGNALFRPASATATTGTALMSYLRCSAPAAVYSTSTTATSSDSSTCALRSTSAHAWHEADENTTTAHGAPGAKSARSSCSGTA